MKLLLFLLLDIDSYNKQIKTVCFMHTWCNGRIKSQSNRPTNSNPWVQSKYYLDTIAGQKLVPCIVRSEGGHQPSSVLFSDRINEIPLPPWTVLCMVKALQSNELSADRDILSNIVSTGGWTNQRIRMNLAASMIQIRYK